MNTISRWFLITSLAMALAVGIGGSASAQSTRLLTEDESVRLGLERNAQLRAVRSDAAEAQAALGEARSARLPSVDARASYTRLSDNIPEAEFTLPGIDSTFTLLPAEVNRYHSEVSVEQPIFTGFRISNQIRAARHQAEAATFQARQEEADVAFQIREAYWRLYQATAIRDAMDVALANVEGYVREISSRVAAGTALRGDLLSVQTRRSEVRLEQIEADNAARVAELELNRLIGAPLGAEVLPQDEPQADSFPSLESLTEQVVAEHPQMNALEEQVEALDAQVRATQGAWLPDVAATGRYVYARPNQYFFLEQDEFRGSWEAGLVLRWSLFDGGRRSAETRGARARLESARARLQDVRERVDVALRRQYLEAERAQRAAEVADESVEDARESLRVARRLYEEGMALSSQVLDAEQAYRQAQTRRAQAMADREIARAALLNAVGQVW